VTGPDSGSLSDLLGQLAGLQREASDLEARLERAEAAASDTAARDPSEQVRVTLTPAGRIKATEIAPGWRSHLTTEELGNAVLAASREAASRRAMANPSNWEATPMSISRVQVSLSMQIVLQTTHSFRQAPVQRW